MSEQQARVDLAERLDQALIDLADGKTLEDYQRHSIAEAAALARSTTPTQAEGEGARADYNAQADAVFEEGRRPASRVREEGARAEPEVGVQTHRPAQVAGRPRPDAKSHSTGQLLEPASTGVREDEGRVDEDVERLERYLAGDLCYMTDEDDAAIKRVLDRLQAYEKALWEIAEPEFPEAWGPNNTSRGMRTLARAALKGEDE